MSKLFNKYPLIRKYFTHQEFEVLDYCKDHHEYMWAAKIMGIILNCDFRESLDVYNLLKEEGHV